VTPHTPELLAQFREHVVEPRRRMLRSVLELAQARGELAGDGDLETAVNALIGVLLRELPRAASGAP
jgi:Tetracyclin repressor-like, C-terminal domain